MVNLFLNYYVDKNPNREKELQICFSKNEDNPAIDQMYVFTQEGDGGRQKITFIPITNRPTFADYFNLINTVTSDNDINIIANTDIYFDEENIELIKNNIKQNECYALSRWDIAADGSHKLFNRPDTADTWVFVGKIKDIKGCNFCLGIPGCLAGETSIKYLRGLRAGGRKITLEHLYYKFNNIKCNKVKWKKELPTFIQSINLDTKEIFYNQILEVIQSGVKKIIQVYFNDNTSLILTNDHPILTESYVYKEAKDLLIGENVISDNLNPVAKGRKKVYAKRSVVYIKYHPNKETKLIRGHTYYRVKKARLVYEANMNNMAYDEFVVCLKKNDVKSKTLKYLPPEIEVHHIDENSLNDHIDNLQILTKSEHAKLHSKKENFNIAYTALKTVVSIKYYDHSVMTYDIRMKGPSNNFLANNVIVHNCDNSIAYKLRSEYLVKNPSKDIKTFHLHLSGVRNYLGTKNRILPPYYLIHPHFLNGNSFFGKVVGENWVEKIKDIKADNMQSQYDEEGIIAFIFKNIGIEHHWFVDLGAGAYDGIMSNTRKLKQDGWFGFGVDMSPTTDPWVIKEFIKPDNACQILKSMGAPVDFDFLNLDIDSCDFYVLQNILKEYRPRLICTEFNGTLEPYIPLVLEYEEGYTWDKTNKYGYSFAAGKKLLEENGYVIIYNQHDTNIFAVRKGLAPENFTEVKAKRNIYHPINPDAKWIQY